MGSRVSGVRKWSVRTGLGVVGAVLLVAVSLTFGDAGAAPNVTTSTRITSVDGEATGGSGVTSTNGTIGSEVDFSSQTKLPAKPANDTQGGEEYTDPSLEITVHEDLEILGVTLVPGTGELGNTYGGASLFQYRDADEDGVHDARDNCVGTPNAGQADTDADNGGEADDVGDACDGDIDGDGVPNGHDTAELDVDVPDLTSPPPPDNDTDGDGVVDGLDNCPRLANADQDDGDDDGIGDACETGGDLDSDGDSVADSGDNCPFVANGPSEDNQDDLDGDTIGDACDDDSDNDGVVDGNDNCPTVQNTTQEDTDGDGVGDACSGDDADADGLANGFDPDNAALDTDGDGADDGDGSGSYTDNCPRDPNPDQADTDDDGIGDACDPDNDQDGDGVVATADNCPWLANATQDDADGDGIGDACDLDDGTDNGSTTDRDSDDDEIPDDSDDCKYAGNTDSDSDGEIAGCEENDGDAGSTDPLDTDGDGVPDGDDNCPKVENAGQTDANDNAVGDACEGVDADGDGIPDSFDPDDTAVDSDGDGVTDRDGSTPSSISLATDLFVDNCPSDPNPLQLDDDSDGVGDACDPDLNFDGDADPNLADDCPWLADQSSANSCKDGGGSGAPLDSDGDGEADFGSGGDPNDNCRFVANADQDDSDGDGIGDACDGDADNDGEPDGVDNCRLVANTQEDTDGDTLGDACDLDDDNDGAPNGFDVDSAQSDIDGDGVLDGPDNCPLVANADQTDSDTDDAPDALSSSDEAAFSATGFEFWVKGDACDNDQTWPGFDTTLLPVVLNAVLSGNTVTLEFPLNTADTLVVQGANTNTADLVVNLQTRVKNNSDDPADPAAGDDLTVDTDFDATSADDEPITKSSTATLHVLEPDLELTKTASEDIVPAGATVTFRVVADNPVTTGISAFDAHLGDELPIGTNQYEFVASSLAPITESGFVAPDPSSLVAAVGASTVEIAADWTEVEAGQKVGFTYQAVAKAPARTGELVNTASVTYNSRPSNQTELFRSYAKGPVDEEVETTDARIRFLSAAGDHPADPSFPDLVSIGSTVTYELELVVPEYDAFDAEVVVTLPPGTAVAQGTNGKPEVRVTDSDDALSSTIAFANVAQFATATAGSGSPAPEHAARVVTVDLGNVTNSDTEPSVDGSVDLETLTLEIDAVVLNIENNGSGTWLSPAEATFNHRRPAREAAEPPISTTTRQSELPTLKVIEPDLTLTKVITGFTPPPDPFVERGQVPPDSLTFEVTIDHVDGTMEGDFSAGSTGDAYVLNLADQLPAGVSIDSSTVRVTRGPDVLVDAGTPTNGAASITVGEQTLGLVVDELAVTRGPSTGGFTTSAEPIVVTYDALVDEDAELAFNLENAVSLTWRGLPAGVDPPASANTFATVRGGTPGVDDPLHPYVESANSQFDLTGTSIELSRGDTSAAHTPDPSVTIGELVDWGVLVGLPTTGEGEPGSFTVSVDVPPADGADGEGAMAGVPGSVQVVTTPGGAGDPRLGLLTTEFNGTVGTPATDTETPGTFDITIPATVALDEDHDNNHVLVLFQTVVTDDPANRGASEGQSASTLPLEVSLQVGTGEPARAPLTAEADPLTVVEPILAVSSEFQPAEAKPGATVLVSATVTNTGTSDAFDVKVEDLLPAARITSVVEVVTPPDYAFQAASTDQHTVAYEGTTVLTEEPRTFVFEALVSPDAQKGDTIVNTTKLAAASTLPDDDAGGGEGDGGGGDVVESAQAGDLSQERHYTAEEPEGSRPVLTVIGPEADLSVTIDDERDDIGPGQPSTYSITVTNNELEDVTTDAVTRVLLDIPLTATLDGGATEVVLLADPVFVPESGTYDGETGVWSGIDLQVGSSVTMELTGVVPADVDPAKVAELFGETEPDTDGGTGETDDGETDGNGDGDADTGGAALTVAQEEDEEQQVGGDGGDGDGSGNPALVIEAGVEPPDITTDPDPSNNTDSDSNELKVALQLTHTQAQERDELFENEPGAYILTITNNGPSSATDLVLTDVLPEGLELIEIRGTGWACETSGRNITCTHPDALFEGQSTVLTYDFVVRLPAGTEITKQGGTVIGVALGQEFSATAEPLVSVVQGGAAPTTTVVVGGTGGTSDDGGDGGGPLARTGANSLPLVGIGAGSAGLGGLVLAIRYWMEQRRRRSKLVQLMGGFSRGRTPDERRSVWP